ncbi:MULTISPECIES: VC0807 family protein [Streptomyces violaceusniger group]|uniref:Integral membrane protein n=1 Tax=Streptomyces rhizosphaericus TaxID=114699 RepID=A0ABP4CX33_9ACTN|nr:MULTISPECIES: VC0807 family protein [Streptomyces violaceusniger group]
MDPSEPTSSPSVPQPARPSAPARRRRLGRLARLALDLGISPLAYYGCLVAGVATLPALLTATGVAALWLAATVLHDRRADGLALAMLLMYGLSAAFAAVTSQPQPLLLRDPLISALAGSVFLTSCLTATPATAYLAGRLHGQPPHEPILLRAHRTETLVCGAGLMAEAVARVLLVLTLPVSTAASLTPPLEFAVLIPLVVWMIRHRGSARTRITARVPSRTRDPEPAPPSVAFVLERHRGGAR